MEKRMPASSHLRLPPTRPPSQVLATPDSLSLVSEPPDIRNWFASYVYESLGASEETCIEVVNEEKSEKLRNTGGSEEAPLSGFNGIAECIEPDESDHGKCDALVLATPDSLSLLSEPPDIRNWFASYVYESPELNTLDGLQDLTGSEETCIEGVNGEKSDKIIIAGRSEKAPRSGLNGIAECIKSDESDHRNCAFRDIHDVETKASLSIQKQSNPKRVGRHNLPGEKGCNHQGSVTNNRAASTHDRSDDTKLEYSLLDITNYNSLSHEKSIRRNITKSNQGKENLYDATSGTLGLTALQEDSFKRPTETTKDNDGFVSTRKKRRQEDTAYALPRDGLQHTTNFEDGAIKNRKVLFDKSDFHYSNVQQGDTGKWECPQRNKPNLGPPLKQLRLEHWVRRV